MSEIPKAIIRQLDMLIVAQGPGDRKRTYDAWYRKMYISSLGMTAKDAVEAGNEKAVIDWLKAVRHGTFA